MGKKIYEAPTIEQLLFREQFIRTSPENDAEIDGDKVYGDDGWRED